MIKTRFEEEPNQFEQWHILDEQIGQNEDKLLLLELVDLRNHFVNAIVANERDKLNKIFDQSLNEGWSAFLKILVEAITNFRFQFCRYMCKISFPIPTEKTKEFENIKKAIKEISHKPYYTLKEWLISNPNYMDDESKQNYFIQTTRTLGKNSDTIDNKVIKKICSNTYIKDDKYP